RQHNVEDHPAGRLTDRDLVWSPIHHQQVCGEHSEEQSDGEGPDPGGDVHGPPPARTASSKHRRSLPPGSSGPTEPGERRADDSVAKGYSPPDLTSIPHRGRRR